MLINPYIYLRTASELPCCILEAPDESRISMTRVFHAKYDDAHFRAWEDLRLAVELVDYSKTIKHLQDHLINYSRLTTDLLAECVAS